MMMSVTYEDNNSSEMQVNSPLILSCTDIFPIDKIWDQIDVEHDLNLHSTHVTSRSCSST